MYLCLLAFCITGGISAQTQNSMTEVIPFKTIDGKIIVEATINGEVADFVLDLSGHNALLPEALKKLHINTEKRGTFSSYQDFVVTAGMADNIVFMLTEFFDTAKVGL